MQEHNKDTKWYKIQSVFTSFDVCRPGDKLVKLLSGEEPGKEGSFECQQTLHLSKTGTEIYGLKVPAEVILIFDEAVVDVANQ